MTEIEKKLGWQRGGGGGAKKILRGEENKGVGGDENNFWGCLAGEMDFENHSYKY